MRRAEILPLVLMTRQAFIVAYLRSCTEWITKKHKKSQTKKLTCAFCAFLWLTVLSHAAGIHQLLHTRNNNKLQRAIRLRGFINLRQTRFAPFSRRRHAEFQV